MCRNIKPLFNFVPPATSTEIRNAALQFVKKVSGYKSPSKANEKAFQLAILSISKDTKKLLKSLTTDAKSKDREAEKEKRAKRFKQH